MYYMWKLQIAENNCDDLGIEHKKHNDLGSPQCGLFFIQMLSKQIMKINIIYCYHLLFVMK